MAILNPVVSKFIITQGIPQKVYSCPGTKTHSILDISFFKDSLTADSLIAVGVSTETVVGNLTSVDYFIDDIELIGIVNSAELSKIIVGANEHLYISVISGADVVVRVSGIEENNSKVIKAGRLSAGSLSTVNQTKIYESTLPNTAYVSTSVTIFNTSTSNNAEVQGWITSSATPAATDKVIKLTIPFNDTTIIENVLLAPNEKIYIQSDQVGTEYFVNGIVISE